MFSECYKCHVRHLSFKTMTFTHKVMNLLISLPGTVPLITEKSESSLASLDSGFDSQSMDVDGGIEEGLAGDKCGKRLSPNAPTTSPELLQAVKKCRENTSDVPEKVLEGFICSMSNFLQLLKFFD